MLRVLSYISLFTFVAFSFTGLQSCKHDPLERIDDDMMPVDTMTIDTMRVDTMSVDTLELCDPDKVYFDRDVLPLLRSNCAFSGCHDANSAEDGVILDSYENTIATADVEPFNLDDSELFEVLVDSREDERMPPAPNDRLSADQIQLISKWILQGALDLDCQPDTSNCDTVDVSFSSQISPVISTYCKGCHSGSVPSGGIALESYSQIQTIALNGKLYGVIAWVDGFKPMPQNGDQLPDCTIDQFKSWIDAGAPNN